MIEIPINDGLNVALVDLDFYELNQWSWSLNNSGYAYASIGAMHRIILPNVKVVHHINGNKLDNQTHNLEAATNSLNMHYAHANANGAVFVPKRNKWQAQIRLPNGHRKFIGYFKTEQEAHEAYLEYKNTIIRLEFDSLDESSQK